MAQCGLTPDSEQRLLLGLIPGQGKNCFLNLGRPQNEKNPAEYSGCHVGTVTSPDVVRIGLPVHYFLGKTEASIIQIS